MSLIADALKTAQRQKQQRESGRPSGAPLFVDLRAPRPSLINRWRGVSIGLSLIVIAASAIVVWKRLRPRPIPGPVLSVPSPLAGTPLLADRAASPAGRAATRRIDSAVIAPRRDFTAPAPGQAGTFANGAAPPADARRPALTSGAAVASTSVTPSSGARLQAATASPAGPATAPPPEATEVRGAPVTGQLRIAVQRPRNDDASRIFAEALTAHRAANLDVARPLYERVLALTPNDADALNNLGVLLSAQKQFDRALELLRRATTLAPRNAGTWNNIGAALREQGRNEEAAAAFRTALGIDPLHAGAKVGLAQQYMATGQPAMARTLLEEVVAANADLAEAQYTLGQALEQLGDREAAIRAFSAFIRVAPARLGEHVERVRRHVETLKAAAP